jgi:hypothetical protein
MPTPPASATPSDASATPSARLLRAAHRAFVRYDGVEGVRLDALVQETGLAPADVPPELRSTDALAEVLLLKAARAYIPKQVMVFAADRPLRDKLRRAAETACDLVEAYPYLPGYLVRRFHKRPDALRALLDRVFALPVAHHTVLDVLQRQLDAEAATGYVRPTRADEFMVMFMAHLFFPPAAISLLEVALGLDAERRAALLARHRERLADDLLRLLRP